MFRRINTLVLMSEDDHNLFSELNASRNMKKSKKTSRQVAIVLKAFRASPSLMGTG